VEHPKFEHHLTPNKDGYQKYVQFKFRIVLKYLNSPLVLGLYASGEGDRLWNRPFLQPSDSCDLDIFETQCICSKYNKDCMTFTKFVRPWIRSQNIPSLTSIYMPNFIEIIKTFCGWTGRYCTNT